MNQPTKDQLKDQLALAADEIIRLRTEHQPYIGASKSGLSNFCMQMKIETGYWRFLRRLSR